ncbi:MAG: hypothetical protein SGARI_002510, partial [Bacillariaceae sp.]
MPSSPSKLMAFLKVVKPRVRRIQQACCNSDNVSMLFGFSLLYLVARSWMAFLRDCVFWIRLGTLIRSISSSLQKSGVSSKCGSSRDMGRQS